MRHFSRGKKNYAKNIMLILNKPKTLNSEIMSLLPKHNESKNGDNSFFNDQEFNSDTRMQ